MCEPTTMFLVGSGLAIYQGAQMVEQGRYELAMGEYRQGVHDYRARVAENEATQARNVGTEKELQVRERAAQILSEQRAQLGASGVQIDTGSAALIQADTETLSEADALRVRDTTDLQVQALEDEAGFETASGEAALAGAKNRQKALNRQAFGTVLTGITTSAISSGVASKWFSPNSAATVGSGFSGSTSGQLPSYLSFTGG